MNQIDPALVEQVREKANYLKNLDIIKRFEKPASTLNAIDDDIFQITKTTRSLYKLLSELQGLPHSERVDSLILLVEMQLKIDPTLEIVSERYRELHTLQLQISSLKSEIATLVSDKKVIFNELLSMHDKRAEAIRFIKLHSELEPGLDLEDHDQIVEHPIKEHNHANKYWIYRLFFKVFRFVWYPKRDRGSHSQSI